MYLDDFKRNFGSVMMDSRNAANKSNKPIASELARGAPSGIQNNIRIRKHDDSDDDDDEGDDYKILAGGEDLRQSFGKKKAGGGSLAEMKAKLSLKEELGALKSELSTFQGSSSQQPASTE